jgi:hypothetical protein
MIKGAFEVIIAFLKAGGCSDEHIRIVRGIAEDVAFPFVDYQGDIMEFFGSNPSGHPLTVIINCIVNSLYMRYAYYVNNPQKEVSSFQHNVHLMTYGDDNGMNASPRVPWFNHTTIQAALREIDVSYTMAEKEAESVPYITFDEVTFLKRHWRFDEEVNEYLAPLDMASIHKMLTMCVASDSICPEEQSIAAISSSVREMWHYGRAAFDDHTSKMRQIVNDSSLELWVEESTFPSFDDLWERFDKTSLGFFDTQA